MLKVLHRTAELPNRAGTITWLSACCMTPANRLAEMSGNFFNRPNKAKGTTAAQLCTFKKCWAFWQLWKYLLHFLGIGVWEQFIPELDYIWVSNFLKNKPSLFWFSAAYSSELVNKLPKTWLAQLTHQCHIFVYDLKGVHSNKRNSVGNPY